jgi:hypothetical protein
MSLGTLLCALGLSDHVDDSFVVVFAAFRACAVRLAQGTTDTLGKTQAGERVMASALAGLGPVCSHSDYHVRDYTLFLF